MGAGEGGGRNRVLACGCGMFHFPSMGKYVRIFLWMMMGLPWVHAAPAPQSVAVLFNSAVPESRRLAEMYAAKRGIPVENLVGLEMPKAADITRKQYEDSILSPLRAEFDRRSWWRRAKQNDGLFLPVINKIRVLVVMRGVPLRIQATPKGEKPAPAAPKQANPLLGRDDASVDSELALFGVETLPAEGILDNKFFRSKVPFEQAGLPFMVLTARIDASSVEICERLIEDAVAAENGGLWGMAYVDVANKFPQGDGWLNTVAAQNVASGIPTVVDRFDATFPRNYPMADAAMYYGWYAWSIDGPFLNPAFRFRRGAVAVHLHSFSAEQLTDPNRNWCAGLLSKGAAVTLGNVHEPYLHLTHDLGLLHQRLVEGHSWVEACWMAMPVCSWQAVVLGDPLYRPFLHLDGSGVVVEEDKPYRAIRAALVRWAGKENERMQQLGQAARRTKEGVYHEAMGLEYMAGKRTAEAIKEFREAKGMYGEETDQLRQALHIAAADHAAGQKDLAIRGLSDATMVYRALPEAQAAKAWLDILQAAGKSGGGAASP